MTEELNLKQIPYGVSNFDYFSAANYYYVDKTHYIKKIEEKGRYLFFIRPRRFGKSLLLSIMEFYYDVKQKENFDTIFNGTYIQQNPTKEKNSYLVLKLDFSAVDANSEKIEEAFLQYIKNTTRTFLQRYQKQLDVDVEKAETKFDSFNSAAVLMNTFLNYCTRNEQKLFVIIDEYDNFANTILSTAGMHEYISITRGEGFLRAFFNVLKSGTSGAYSPISRLFMTGVSPITLDDVTSGFNIATNISLHSDLNEMLGFNRHDVETMIEYYEQTGKIRHTTAELLVLMSHWYNHYRFSTEATQEVFNPVQVLYFLSEYLIDSKIPQTLIDQNVRMDYHKLRHLIIIDQKGKALPNGNFSKLKDIIENQSVQTILQKSFPINKLTEPENFLSLLFYFGLLTIIGETPTYKTILAIPNETIKHLFYDYISKSYDETGFFSFDLNKYSELIDDMALNGCWQPLIEYLVERIDASSGLRDFITGEKVIQTFLNVYLGLSNLYSIYSEKESNKGFADLLLEPRLLEYPAIKYAYLIELKYIKATAEKTENTRLLDVTDKIKTLREEAENQLNHYAVDEKLQRTLGHTTLIKLVLIFCGHRLVHSSQVEDKLLSKN